MSAFRHCILVGYLLSLNRELFQIDRQTECYAECVNWNYHIQQFPSPGAGLELGSALMSRVCQEQFYLLIIPHLIQYLGFFFSKQLAQVFLGMPSRTMQDCRCSCGRKMPCQNIENIYIHLCEKDYCFQGFYFTP